MPSSIINKVQSRCAPAGSHHEQAVVLLHLAIPCERPGIISGSFLPAYFEYIRDYTPMYETACSLSPVLFISCEEYVREMNSDAGTLYPLKKRSPGLWFGASRKEEVIRVMKFFLLILKKQYTA